MSGSAADIEKPSDDSHKCRRTDAMASMKVGAGLAYQAAVRWVSCPCCRNRWAARVIQEKNPHQGRRSASDGPIGPLALGCHAQVCPSLHEGNFQLPSQHKPFQNLHRAMAGSVHSNACGANSPWGLIDDN